MLVRVYTRELMLWCARRYSVLMNGAEERHDYMKWRRDRAVRLSTAKEQLQYLHANDMAQWTTGTASSWIWCRRCTNCCA